MNKFQTNSTSQIPTTTRLLTQAESTLTYTRPKLFYTPYVWEALWYIINKSPKEIGWWGLIEPIGTDYIVTDLYIPQQTVHSAETDITPETMVALIEEIMGADKDPSKLLYWGHSHVNMGVSPSGQDETQVQEYLENHQGIFIRGIYNKKGEAKIDVYDTITRVVHQKVDHGPYHKPLTDEDKAGLDALLKANVKEYVYQAPKYTGYAQNLNLVEKSTQTTTETGKTNTTANQGYEHWEMEYWERMEEQTREAQQPPKPTETTEYYAFMRDDPLHAETVETLTAYFQCTPMEIQDEDIEWYQEWRAHI